MAWKKQEWVKEGYRRCPCCKEIKELTATFFYRKKSEIGWFRYDCKDCTRVKDKERHSIPENKKKNLESSKRYYRTPRWREVMRNNWNIRRARKLSTSDWSVTHELLENLLEEQEFSCNICICDINDRTTRHLDHIIPLSKWGWHTADNVQWLCCACNLSKGATNAVPTISGQAAL